MRKALTLLAGIGAFMLLTAGIASAQTPDYEGDETTTTTVEETTTTTADEVTTTTAAPTTTEDDGIIGEEEEAPATLPATGSNSLPLAQIAIVMVAAGGLGLLLMRRQTAEVSTTS